MAPDTEPARYISLHGAITAGGMMTNSFDVTRDRCTIHLHLNSGGALIELHDGERVYVSSSAIQAVELYPAKQADLRAPQDYDVTRPRHVSSLVIDDWASPKEAAKPLEDFEKIMREVGVDLDAATPGRTKRKKRT